MTATYNLANAIGQVRLYANDKDVTPASDAYLTDEEIAILLSKVNNDVYLAAAAELRIKACDKAYVAKNFRIGSYSESNDYVKDLLALAESYEKKAESQGIGPDGEFLVQEAIAELAYTDDNWNQILLNKDLRGDTD